MNYGETYKQRRGSDGADLADWPVRPKDVSSLYPEPQPSANAIAQVFQALEKKGYLTHETKGRGFVYRPIVDKQAYGRGRLSSVINRFFSDSYMSVVSALMQEEKVTEADLLQYLADLKRKEG